MTENISSNTNMSSSGIQPNRAARAQGGYPAYQSVPAQQPSPDRDDTIFRKTMEEAREMRESMGKKKWEWRHRSYMPFKLRVCLFAAILAVFLLAYCISFATGARWGADINNICDNIMMMLADGLFGILGFFAGRDWSDKAIPLQRLLTLGPTSYVIIASVVSAIASGIVASVWSYNATKNSRDDGTSNFRAETEYVASAKPQEVDEFDGMTTEEQVKEYAMRKYLGQGMNRAQAENASKTDIAKFRATRNK